MLSILDMPEVYSL